MRISFYRTSIDESCFILNYFNFILKDSLKVCHKLYQGNLRLAKALYIVSKLFIDRIKESIFIIHIILLHLLILLSICSLKSSLESKINPNVSGY